MSVESSIWLNRAALGRHNEQMSFPLELVEAQGFWTAVAGASTALLIAIVVEGRTARDDLEVSLQQLLVAHREHQAEWDAWRTEFEARYQQSDGLSELPATPTLVPELDVRRSDRHINRVSVLMGALLATAGSVLGSLITISPGPYPGGMAATLGTVGTLTLFVVGLSLLVGATCMRLLDI
jgi:hypothetical protein